ncbi:MAG TPA: DUF4410 domain-containing protein, partial [Geobacteraceae bacterium]
MKKLRYLMTMLAVGLGCCALTGCAPTNVAVQSQYYGLLPQPDRILVTNFAVSPDEVKIDPGITGEVKSLVDGTQTPKTSQEIAVGRSVSDALAASLVKQLRALGYPAARASGTAPGAAKVLLIEGQIFSIDEGNRAERVAIGLGAGRSDVKTYTQIYEMLPSGRKLVEQLQTDAKSGYKPGMLETEGASIVAGHWAAGLAVGAGLNVASEKYGANVKADAERTAKEIAQRWSLGRERGDVGVCGNMS